MDRVNMLFLPLLSVALFIPICLTQTTSELTTLRNKLSALEDRLDNVTTQLQESQRQLQQSQAHQRQYQQLLQDVLSHVNGSSRVASNAFLQCSAVQQCCQSNNYTQELRDIITKLDLLITRQQQQTADLVELQTAVNSNRLLVARQQTNLTTLRQGQTRQQDNLDALVRGQTRQLFDIGLLVGKFNELKLEIKQDFEDLNQTSEVMRAMLEDRDHLNISQLVQGQNHVKRQMTMMKYQLERVVNFTARPASCREFGPKNKKSVYDIWIRPWYTEKVFCDGDWIVIQRRKNGEIDFYRDWDDYKTGFGNKTGEYWLGLEALHKLTATGKWELRVDLGDFRGNTAYALYAGFTVASESKDYKLYLSKYVGGTAGDSLFSAHNKKKFLTKDRETSSRRCTQRGQGGWWYASCYDANLNGVYRNSTQSSEDSIVWKAWKQTTPLKFSEMKIRPV